MPSPVHTRSCTQIAPIMKDLGFYEGKSQTCLLKPWTLGSNSCKMSGLWALVWFCSYDQPWGGPRGHRREWPPLLSQPPLSLTSYLVERIYPQPYDRVAMNSSVCGHKASPWRTKGGTRCLLSSQPPTSVPQWSRPVVKGNYFFSSLCSAVTLVPAPIATCSLTYFM